MKIILILTVLAFIFTSFFSKKAYATEVSHPSAQLAVVPTAKAENVDLRVNALRNILKKYNSPLADYSDLYIKYADQNGVDWRLLPAITGVESSFGIYLNKGSFNAYGWDNGAIYFDSWEDGIKIIDASLRQNYINQGATDVWSIGTMYAASPTWAARVNAYMDEINQEYLRLSTFAKANI